MQAKHVLRSLALSAALLAPLAGCSDSSSGSDFTVSTVSHAVDGITPLVVGGRWFVYFADEGQSGVILNGDGLMDDDVAVVVDMGARTETVLGVVAEDAVIRGDDIYLVVDESDDGTDWGGAVGTGDTVLLHWSLTAGVVSFVDVLGPNGDDVDVLVVGTRVFYVTDAALAAPTGDETTLRVLESTAPLVPVVVSRPLGLGTLDPILMGTEAGLLFLLADEAREGVDLNGDGDTAPADAHVLVLVDATLITPEVLVVPAALEDDDTPIAARATGLSDWTVAFLVSEAEQGMDAAGVNLNDPASFTNPLVPNNCLATPDTDVMDDVLHYLDFADFAAGTPGALVNTGLAGVDRVEVVNDFVAALSDEDDANCDLNDDGDTDDVVVRWVETATPVAPPRDTSLLHAVDTLVPGGAMGFSRYGNRLVCVVDEADDSDDLDGKAPDHSLVAWLDPADGPTTTWEFSHQNPGNPFLGTGIFDSMNNSEPFAGVSWFAREERGRLPLAFQEEVPGTNPNISSLNNNIACNRVDKDTDLVDSLPVWADFGAGPTLDFDGVGFAVSVGNAGIVVAGGNAFFRVDESADNRDYNADGNADMVLFRNPLTACSPVFMGTASTVVGPVVITDGVSGGVFLTDEFAEGTSLNVGDTDVNDLVPRYFLF